MVSVVIVAAGSGKRMGGPINKVFMDLLGYPILFHSIQAFEKLKKINEIIIVLRKDEIDYYNENFKLYGFKKVTKVVSGGKERLDSVLNGLKNLNEKSNKVLIHDGARPLIDGDTIETIIETIKPGIGSAPAILVKDTIKIVDDKNFITSSPNRASLRAIQTPQGFITKEIIKAYENISNNQDTRIKNNITDDTSIYKIDGNKVSLIEGKETNIKITTELDMIIAQDVIHRLK